MLVDPHNPKSRIGVAPLGYLLTLKKPVRNLNFKIGKIQDGGFNLAYWVPTFMLR